MNEASGSGMLMLMLKSMAALAAVLALFALVIWLIRRFRPGLKIADEHMLMMEQRISLDGKNAIAVIRCGGQRWLIGLSPAGPVRIDRLDPEHREPEEDEVRS